MKTAILVFGLALTCLGLGASITHQEAIDPVTAEEMDYARWEVCIKESDGSDAECQACDAKYNPNGYDFRIYN